MAYVTGRTRGGKEWTPRFVKSIDPELCIGCGRCIKICAHDVLAPAEVDEEDRTAARANAVAECSIVYTVQIGGPAAAKLVARKIHPMKTGTELPIADAIAKLQQVLKGNPPPWLRKAMGGAAAPSFSADE